MNTWKMTVFDRRINIPNFVRLLQTRETRPSELRPVSIQPYDSPFDNNSMLSEYFPSSSGLRTSDINQPFTFKDKDRNAFYTGLRAVRPNYRGRAQIRSVDQTLLGPLSEIEDGSNSNVFVSTVPGLVNSRYSTLRFGPIRESSAMDTMDQQQQLPPQQTQYVPEDANIILRRD
jgi:hypothetical protein